MPQCSVSTIQVHVYRIHGGAEHLILRRASAAAPYPRMMQVVTGNIEAGETANAAALRELREETGLEPLECYVLPFVGAFYRAHTDTVEQIPAFAALVPDDIPVTLSPEHDAFFWLPLDEAERALVMPSQRQGARLLQEFLFDAEKKKILARIV